MRHYLEGYPEASRTSERYLREQEHNDWHTAIEAAITTRISADLLALLSLYFGHLHDDNVDPESARGYL